MNGLRAGREQQPVVGRDDAVGGDHVAPRAVDRARPSCPRCSVIPFAAYQSRSFSMISSSVCSPDEHRREQDAVVVRVRLGAEDRDVVGVGRELQQLLERAHAGHAVADHHEARVLRSGVRCGVALRRQRRLLRRAPAAGTGSRAPRCGSGGTARSRRARRGRAAAAARSSGSRRSWPRARWSSSRCGRTSSTASSTSCVTISTVLPVAATIFISSSCSRARVSASSAPNGSSSSSTFGSIASARAMPTRCFMPPEISCGNLCSACVRPTSASASCVRRFRSALRLARAEHALDGEVHVVEAGEPRQQRMVLEHDAALGTRARDLAAGAEQDAGRRREEARRRD